MSAILKKDLIFDKAVLSKGQAIKVIRKHGEMPSIKEYHALIKNYTDIKLEIICVSEKDGSDWIEYVYISEVRKGRVEIELLGDMKEMSKC